MDELENQKKTKKKRGFEIALNVTLITLGVIALAVAGVLIYQKSYLTPFWVNGQSMYPTLNKEALRADGTALGVKGGGCTDGCKNIDYGVMDKHERALKKLKRFDIVVCTYSFGDENDKIKRIIGMPGETIKFGQGGNKGELYVKEGDTFTLIEQPIENEYVVSGTYPTHEIKLADDEYYVLGDNRAHSSDSRTNGPIKYEWLVGKVVALCAYCEIRKTADGSLEPYNIKHYSPRFL